MYGHAADDWPDEWGTIGDPGELLERLEGTPDFTETEELAARFVVAVLG